MFKKLKQALVGFILGAFVSVSFVALGGVEAITYISDFNPAWPLGTDHYSTTDNHIRNMKQGIQATFPAVNGAMLASEEELNILDGATLTVTELNYVDGVTSALQTQLNAKAATAHNHAAADTTSGTFADARIAASNVTQHLVGGLAVQINGRNINAKAGTSKTLSTSAASGGSDGDIWYRY